MRAYFIVEIFLCMATGKKRERTRDYAELWDQHGKVDLLFFIPRSIMVFVEQFWTKGASILRTVSCLHFFLSLYGQQMLFRRMYNYTSLPTYLPPSPSSSSSPLADPAKSITANCS